MILLFLWDRLAGFIAVELDQDMAERGDILVLRAALRHRVDPQEQPELGAEHAVDPALGRHLRFPLGCRECDATARRDLALLVLRRRGNGDEFIWLETRVEEADETVVQSDRQRHRRALAVDRCWCRCQPPSRWRRDFRHRRHAGAERFPRRPGIDRADGRPRFGLGQPVGQRAGEQLGFRFLQRVAGVAELAGRVEEFGIAHPLARAALEVFQRAARQGHGEPG